MSPDQPFGQALEQSLGVSAEQPGVHNDGHEDAPMALVSYCGEEYKVTAGMHFTVGRDADLCIDKNPFLHRKLLRISFDTGMWWIENTGSRIAATVADASGMMQAWVGPGARIPIAFEAVTVVFSAGPTTYEFDIEVNGVSFKRSGMREIGDGETTVGEVTFTPSQFLLILALAEPWLLRAGSGAVDLPKSSAAAQRLGWPLTRFNRKLDNVADKLDKMGVSGLRGGNSSHATHRRVRLVEYAVSARLVNRDDLYLLDEEAARNRAHSVAAR